jgi:tetratricopeptide (TPR) repeat protein
MKKLWDAGLILKLLGLLILISLLGITPRPHTVRRGGELARQAQEYNAPLAASNQLAFLAEYQPWRSDLWERAAHLALQASEPKTAINYYERANDLTHAGYLALGDAYAQEELLDSAIQAWEDGLTAHGPSAEILNRLAESYFAQDDYDNTITALQTLISIDHQPLTLYKLGLLLAAHNPASAPPYLLQAAESDSQIEPAARELAFVIQRALPKDEPAYTLLIAGRQLAKINYWDLATHAFQQAVQLRPDYAEAWAYLGEAYQHSDDPASKDGLHELQQALKLDANSLAANTFMALYWQRQNDSEQAQVYLQSASAIDPYNSTLIIQLGEMWALSGDLDTAQAYYQQAIELDPYDPVPYRALAEFGMRYNLDLREVSLPAARQALELDTDHPASLDTMGQVLFSLGDQLNAERFYLRALEQDPNHAPAHLHLGLLYIFQKEFTLAQNHLTQALSLAPGTATADHARRLMEDYLVP